MDIKHQKITLEVNELRSFKTVVAKQGDNQTRVVDIVLTDDEEEINLTGCSAIVKVSLNGEYKAMNPCEIDYEKNLIYFPLEDNILDTPGMLNCEITLYENEEIISSGMFNIKVGKSVIPDDSELVGTLEYGVLTQLIKDVAEIQENSTNVYNELNSMTDRFDAKENISNKMNNIAFPSNNYYPTNGAVWNYVASELAKPKQDIATTISDLANTTSNLANLQQDYDATKNLVKGNAESVLGLSFKLSDIKTELTDKIKRVEIEKSGLVVSKNIFNMADWLNFIQGLENPIYNGTLDTISDDSFTFTSTDNYSQTLGWQVAGRRYEISVEPNTDYTISWNSQGAEGDVGKLIVFFNADMDNQRSSKTSDNQLTFTTGEDTEFITMRFGVNEAGRTATISKIQIEKGTERTFYLPHLVAVGVNEIANNLTNS